jgi:type II restriction/modification system DNA methylase subunit YeeA
LGYARPPSRQTRGDPLKTKPGRTTLIFRGKLFRQPAPALIGAGNDVTYSNTAVFETFPFPEGLTPDIPATEYASDSRAQTVAAAVQMLQQRREAWLNPPDLVRRAPEVVPGFPDRIFPVDDAAAVELKKRTLTNLYSQRPAWLDNVHKALDAAVAAAYGWTSDLSDDEILSRLLALNAQRS